MTFWVRLILGSIFILASVDKIYDPAAFAQVVHNYQILPDELINLTAILLPWIELIVGILLMGGMWLPGAATLANALLGAFLAALVFNAARGLNVHCGCFGSTGSGNASVVWYFLRDAVFLMLSAYLFARVFRKNQG